ncbi:ferritin heavy chain A-like [Rhineura floridana]|uniref:ferritin heavy chain A-like n=1 Tax=Rhineura floridana TaxID=261503 RepID=UPI002AC83EF9|nr:ferritin heavy chain A-like [Rhineura floridana]
MDLQKSNDDQRGNSLEVLQSEKVSQALQDPDHNLETGKEDLHRRDFVESEYLEKQVKVVKALGDHITNLKHLGAPQNAV